MGDQADGKVCMVRPRSVRLFSVAVAALLFVRLASFELNGQTMQTAFGRLIGSTDQTKRVQTTWTGKLAVRLFRFRAIWSLYAVTMVVVSDMMAHREQLRRAVKTRNGIFKTAS